MILLYKSQSFVYLLLAFLSARVHACPLEEETQTNGEGLEGGNTNFCDSSCEKQLLSDTPASFESSQKELQASINTPTFSLFHCLSLAQTSSTRGRLWDQPGPASDTPTSRRRSQEVHWAEAKFKRVPCCFRRGQRRRDFDGSKPRGGFVCGRPTLPSPRISFDSLQPEYIQTAADLLPVTDCSHVTRQAPMRHNRAANQRAQVVVVTLGDLLVFV